MVLDAKAPPLGSYATIADTADDDVEWAIVQPVDGGPR